MFQWHLGAGQHCYLLLVQLSSRDGKVVVMPPELKKRHVAAQHRKEQGLAIEMCGRVTAVHSPWAAAALVCVRPCPPKRSANIRGTSLAMQCPS